MNTTINAEIVEQRHLDAYTPHDIEAILATYADDAEIFAPPSQSLGRGATELRARSAARFQERNLHVTMLKRIAMPCASNRSSITKSQSWFTLIAILHPRHICNPESVFFSSH